MAHIVANSLCLLLTVHLVAGNQCAQDLVYNSVIPVTKTVWTDLTSLTFGLFDPSLGKLDSVQFDVEYAGNATVSVTLQNDPRTPDDPPVFQPALINTNLGLSLPANQALQGNYIFTQTFNRIFQPFTTPAAGTYNQNYLFSGNFSILVTEGLDQFLGTGTSVFGAVATGQGSGTFDNNPGAQVAGTLYVGISVRVAYLYAKISLNKKLNGNFQRVAPGPRLFPGTPISWSYEITNTGTADLWSVAVADNQLGTGVVNCGAGTTILTACSIMTCTATSTASGFNQYTNIAIASAVGVDTGMFPPQEGVSFFVSNTDIANYLPLVLSISLRKTTNNQHVFASGDLSPPTLAQGSTVTWSYTVTNNGNAILTSITVVDNQVGTISSCPSNFLAVGSSFVCTAQGVAQVGSYTNTALATGIYAPTGASATATDISGYTGSSAGITLLKTTNGVNTHAAQRPTLIINDAVTWTYVVTNSGTEQIVQISLTDNQLGSIGCPASTLSIGQSMTCFAFGTATASGLYTNIGSVTGVGAVTPNTVSASYDSAYFTVVPAIDLLKLTNNLDATMAVPAYAVSGYPVTWKYIVTNTGNVDLSSVTVVDDPVGPIACVGLPNPLQVGSSFTCLETGTAIDGSDLYHNTATAQGSAFGGTVQAFDESWYLPVVSNGAATIVKRTNNVSYADGFIPRVRAGDLITWTYEITNIGNVDLSSVGVNDDRLDSSVIMCPPEAADLAPGQSITCSAVGTANKCGYSNVGCVTTFPPLRNRTCSTGAYNGIHPGISLTKYTNNINPVRSHNSTNPPCLAAGCEVIWSYVVSNVGDDLLTNVYVWDDALDRSAWCPINKLSPWQTITCLSREPPKDEGHGESKDGKHNRDSKGEGKSSKSDKRSGKGEGKSGKSVLHAEVLSTPSTPTQPKDVVTAGLYTNVASAFGSPKVGGPPVVAVDENWYFGVTAGMRLTVNVNNVVVQGGVDSFNGECPKPKPIDTCKTCHKDKDEKHESHDKDGEGGSRRSHKSGGAKAWKGGDELGTGANANPGDALNFKFTVQNYGTEDLNLVYISFPEQRHSAVPFISISAEHDVTCPSSTLAAGSSMTCTATAVVLSYGQQWLKVRATAVGACDGVNKYEADAVGKWFSVRPQIAVGEGEGEAHSRRGKKGANRSRKSGEGEGRGEGAKVTPPPNPLPVQSANGGCDATFWIANAATYPSQWTPNTPFYQAAGLKSDPVSGRTLANVLKGDDSGLNPFYRASATALLNAATNVNFGVSLASVQADIAAALSAYFVQGDDTLLNQYLQLFNGWAQPC